MIVLILDHFLSIYFPRYYLLLGVISTVCHLVFCLFFVVVFLSAFISVPYLVQDRRDFQLGLLFPILLEQQHQCHR